MADISSVTLPDGNTYDFKDTVARKTSGVVGSITIGTSWSGSGPYTQTVTATGYTVTANTIVDLMTDSAVINQLQSDGVEQLYISNTNAALTAVAVGGKSSAEFTVAAVFSEVN